MPHLQLRLWSSSTADTESPRIGEPFFDPNTRRLGVWGSNNKVNWLPAVNSEFISPDIGQRLAGIVQGGDVNSVGLDLSVPDEVRVVNVRSGTVIARFTGSGSYFTSAQVNGVQRLGVSNHVVNAGLQVKRSFGSPSGSNPWRSTGALADRSKLVAPNWQLWCAPDRAGTLEVTLVDDVPFAGPRRSARLVPVMSPSHAGLRVFVHDAVQLAGQKVSFSVYVKGTTGAFTQQRILTPANLVKSVDVIGTDTWNRVATTVTMPSRNTLLNANFVAYDVLYNPTGGSSAYWQVCAPQVSLGESPVDFDIRPIELEETMVSRVYTERVTRFKRGEKRELPWNLIEGFTETYIEMDPVVPVVQTFVGNQGATVSIAEGATSYLSDVTIKVAGYRMPFLQESLGT